MYHDEVFRVSKIRYCEIGVRGEREEERTGKHSNYHGKETSADGALPFKANMAE